MSKELVAMKTLDQRRSGQEYPTRREQHTQRPRGGAVLGVFSNRREARVVGGQSAKAAEGEVREVMRGRQVMWGE